MAKTQSTEVAVKAQTAVALAAPEFMDAADFGAGFEGADKDSYAIPFLQILQKLSPIADEDNQAHIEGAKAGMLFNTVTQKLYDVRSKPLVFIPCFFKRSFILWGSRDAQGGFKGEVTPEEMDKIIASGAVENVSGKLLVKDEKGNVDAKKSDYWADTRSHYVIAVDPDTGEFGAAILSLASSQIKASKMLITSLSQRKVEIAGHKRTPPMFANMVKVSTVAKQNEQGAWAGVTFELEPGLVTDKNLFAAAKEFYTAVSSGAVQADYSKSVDAGDSSVSGEAQEADKF